MDILYLPQQHLIIVPISHTSNHEFMHARHPLIPGHYADVHCCLYQCQYLIIETLLAIMIGVLPRVESIKETGLLLLGRGSVAAVQRIRRVWSCISMVRNQHSM